MEPKKSRKLKKTHKSVCLSTYKNNFCGKLMCILLSSAFQVQRPSPNPTFHQPHRVQILSRDLTESMGLRKWWLLQRRLTPSTSSSVKTLSKSNTLNSLNPTHSTQPRGWSPGSVACTSATGSLKWAPYWLQRALQGRLPAAPRTSGSPPHSTIRIIWSF